MTQVASILCTEGLSVAFGGHLAVDDVDFEVPEHAFISIIGPNGAGKTTFFNLLSGQLKPTKGRIWFRGAEITHLPPEHRAMLGVGRSFQIANILPNLTTFENVRLAVQAKRPERFRFFRHHRSFSSLNDRVAEILGRVSLWHKREALARYLTHGEKRKLEIAMLLAMDSALFLLDEPTAGMSVEEVPQILDVISALRDERKRTILLIEHKVDMVLNLSDTVAVLHQGRLIAQGPPQAIMQNELVQTAYLGGLGHVGAS
ncbi:MAG: Branched-chain amino acid transport ATP-binding protein LivG [Candidatus Carbobacillus altaicus]|uniref:Branched-chain amino acid transport ATP-binding protein LivG n=1 Tax=Candidatus Carbonibacillus altaicus TaxID=2163959 RepID=A0A2R6Y1Y0_9BACL|nr:MAG: Branched-chain amino acid transport ATP-binding protein LivG [Candidatus Carbobacillus altaicus]